VAVSGGLAGDGARFGETWVAADAIPAKGVIVAVGFYGEDIRFGHGSAGGWNVFGPRRTITQSIDNVLFELDGQPALDLYERYLGPEEAALLPGSALLFPLSIRDPDAPDRDVVRTVLASLSLFDFTLIDADRTLGCSYGKALRKVMAPALAPAFLTSCMFAFLASMDNYPVSIFFTDAWTKTLPLQMLQLVEERPDPTIAAVSTGLIVLAIVVLIIGDRLVGLRRLADF
jgi:hypothetical protein